MPSTPVSPTPDQATAGPERVGDPAVDAAVSGATRPRRRRWWLWALSLVVLAVIAVPVLTAGYVVMVAGRDERGPSDVIIVLGAAQFDGTPSPVLQARLEQAKVLYDEGVSGRILTVGANQPGDRFTEAGAGRQWLIDQGVPADSITAVGVGTDTASSLAAGAEWMQSQGLTSATLVTDPAHEARSAAIANNLGISVQTSPSQQGAGSALTFEYVLRETAGLLQHWFIEARSMPRVINPL